MKFLSDKKHLIFFILFSFFIQHECFAAKADKYYIVGLTKSGINKTLSKTNLKSFQHPAFFKNNDLYRILTSLYYKKFMEGHPLWENQKRAVFHSKEAKKITPLLRKSLEKSTSKKMVYFAIGKAKEKTTGNIFFADSKLYFYFKNIKGEVKRREDPRAQHDQWKLVLQKNQSYLEQKGLLGLVDSYTNWLIIETSKRKQSREEKEPVLNQSKQSGYPEIENKLRFLKKMLDEGLITEKDFEEKKEKLLDRL